jgi:hypothetical protein
MKKGFVIAAIAASQIAVGVSPATAASFPIYVEPVASGVSLNVIGTVGDAVDGYQMVGIPDGMGLVKEGKKLSLITNHELSATNAVAAARTTASGAAFGAFVSKITLDPKTLKPTAAEDLFSTVSWYDYANGTWGTKPTAPLGAALKDSFGTPNHTNTFNRFCSATLAPAGTFYNKKTGNGFKDALFLTGEEGTDESRGFASTLTGEVAQIPGFGLAAWENFTPVPTNNDVTAVMSNEDQSVAVASQLFMYVGKKQKSGTFYEKAGLANGKNYVLSGFPGDDNMIRTMFGKNSPIPVEFTEINYLLSGKEQNEKALEKGLRLSRVEDGNFDPKNPNDYYFVTTESNKDPKATTGNPEYPGTSRDGGALWRLRFDDVTNPLKGGTLEMLLDGSEDVYMSKPDNITIDNKGNLLIQEDPGGNDAVARIVAYRISDGALGVVAKFKDQYFKKGGADFITNDEESSGIIDVSSFLKKGSSDKATYFMFNAQVHAPAAKARMDITDATAVANLAASIEGGQWYVMKITDWKKVYGF